MSQTTLQDIAAMQAATLTPEQIAPILGWNPWFCACLRRLEAQNRILQKRQRPTPTKPLSY